MDSRPVTVRGLRNDGSTGVRRADLILCPGCGGCVFLIFVFDATHSHLQCAECDEAYCQGADGCPEPEPEPEPLPTEPAPDPRDDARPPDEGPDDRDFPEDRDSILIY